jgi:HEAT repeat protein
MRAAACKALGLMRSPSSRPHLLEAARDGEWCTATEARKALG